MYSPPPFLLLLLLLLAVAAAATHYPKEAHPTKSGYLTVNSTTGSAIFYTFYESKTPPKNNTPILIWLQGGPGCSSMLANFREVGPWILNEHISLEPNSGPWNTLFGLLFIDNPIGTGFSIAASHKEIPTNQYDVAKHLITAIRRFISLDKSFKTRPIYITGESYAGKYIPVLAYHILKQNSLSSGERKINLAGIAIGNGLTDPEIQVSTHASNSYNLGLVNARQMSELEKLQSDTVGFIRRGQWKEATETRTQVLDRLTNLTGLATLYDFRRLTPYPNKVVAKFLNDAEVKKVLGVKESLVFELCSKAVGSALHDDVMKSVRNTVDWLVKKKTKVLLYQGQCDLRDGVFSTLSWVEKMKWDGVRKFLEAERKVWRVDGLLAGYVQKWEGFSHAVVLNAGHLVPTDQPVNSQVMIQDWVLERGLFGGKDGK